MGKDNQTLSEKIFSNKSGVDCYPGQVITMPVDLVMAHDSSGPLVIKILDENRLKPSFKPGKTIFVIDHYVPCPNDNVAELHELMRKYAQETGAVLYDAGEGICHQLLAEKGHVKPGDLVVGSDSHTCTLGSLGAFATGVGSTDLAVAIHTGKMWFKAPQSIEIKVQGTLQHGVSAKDVILAIASKLGANGATYRTMEFKGELVSELTVEQRMTICNMAVELGAKAGIIEPDRQTFKWLANQGIQYDQSGTSLKADDNAHYEQSICIDASYIEPVVALPHTVDRVVPVATVSDLKIQMAFLGTCTNGRLEDLSLAAEIISRFGIAPNVQVLVAPASKKIYLEAIKRGILEKLIEAGAIIMPPGCAACIGSTGGIPGAGDNVVSTANRNFKGRMGNEKANIFLTSPATLAASCVTGYLTDPRDFMA